MSGREECQILVGSSLFSWWILRGFGPIWIGEPTSVHFPGDGVIRRHRARKDVLGWWHTHPGMTASPSAVDDATMRAWVFALGRPLFCIIEGSDGIRAWLYVDDDGPSREVWVRRLFGRFWLDGC